MTPPHILALLNAIAREVVTDAWAEMDYNQQIETWHIQTVAMAGSLGV